MDQWGKRVYNFARRYANDDHFANEVVQQTFIQAFEKLDQLKDPTKLQSGLYRIASNNCISQGRRLARRRQLEENGLIHTPDPANPSQVVERKELRDMVLKVLQMIPPEQRQVIIMKEYEGLKFREIAGILEASENTIKARMYYGLDAKRKIMIQNKLNKDLYYE
ncbi:MAG: RNA polymerase sigma factor [Saprospiraceae bacterium]|nr:RNA polymerase sigma factor [Saprospiraceae bacterium]